MSRKINVEDSETAMLIYNALIQFVLDRQTIPSKFAFFRNVLVPSGIEITIGSFDHWMGRLVDEGYIEIEATTNSLRIPRLPIIDTRTNQQTLPFLNAPIPSGRSEGYVYVIKSEHGYKIGSTDDIDARLRSLRFHYPFRLDLCCLIKAKDRRAAENLLHRTYRHKRITSEWFDLADTDIDCIKSYPNAIEFSDEGMPLK